jgi:crinkler effector protein
MAELKLWCFVEGQTEYFYVRISPTQDVYSLKMQIHTCNDIECKVANLALYKVRYIMISM